MKQMTIRGIGEKLQFITIGYAALVIYLNYLFYPLFRINTVQYKILLAAGILLIMAGIPLNILTTIRIVKGFKRGILLTDGIFSFVRHPLYASYILLIVPGICLLFASWIILTVPIVMYVAFRILVRQEERFLEERFGDRYSEYKMKVNMIFPKIF